ncbi:MAG: hypothetical protein K9H48_21805 [Melioribacteraceae bacterium]|nr:hypothetical protein [Melioribacteraceae bacterium]
MRLICSKLLLIISILFFLSNKLSSIINIGLLYGSASSITTEAIEGYSMTKFEKGSVYGLSISIVSKIGLGCELLIEKYEQDIEEEGVKLGTLKSNPVLFLFKYHSRPWSGEGIAFSFDIGGGFNYSSFDNGYYLEGIRVSNEDSFVFELGAGISYFFSPKVSVAFDWKLLAGNVGTKWSYENTIIDDIDLFYTSNSQPMLILRYWF